MQFKSETRPLGITALSIFFLFGAAASFISSVSLLFPGSFLEQMWRLNALTNYIIFRARNLRLSFIIGNLFPILDVTLFICLLQLDKVAAWSLVPYLLYRIYALWWGYGLWKMNSVRPSLLNPHKIN